MREIQQLFIYLAGTTCLVVSILATGAWAFSAYRSERPVEPAHTTAVAGESDVAHVRSYTDNPLRRPVWIEPTIKYVYAPLDVMAVKSAPTPHVAPPRAQEKSATKPIRQPHTVRIDREARRAYGSAGSAERGQQLLILPLQHQAPN